MSGAMVTNWSEVRVVRHNYTRFTWEPKVRLRSCRSPAIPVKRMYARSVSSLGCEIWF